MNDETADYEERRDWFFTFGTGHLHPRSGESLGRRFVRFYGTRAQARRRMLDAFGIKWSHQYASAAAAGADLYGLTELDVTELDPALDESEREPMSKFNGPGRYDPEATALREQLRAEGIVLIVRNGVKGDGFEVQLGALDLVNLPDVLRQIADQVEAQLMGGEPT